MAHWLLRKEVSYGAFPKEMTEDGTWENKSPPWALRTLVLSYTVGRQQFPPQIILKHYEAEAINLGKQGSMKQNR